MYHYFWKRGKTAFIRAVAFISTKMVFESLMSMITGREMKTKSQEHVNLVIISLIVFSKPLNDGG